MKNVNCKIKQIVIVSNGTLENWIIPHIQHEDFIIGVDHASYWLLEHAITPDMAIGDFDSCSENEINIIRSRVRDIREFDSHKDETDLELATLAAIDLHPERVSIFGSFGSRLDHQLGSIFLLNEFLKKQICARMVNERNNITMLDSQEIIQKEKEMKYLSILPFTSEILYDISGCLYNGTDIIVRSGQTRGISNEIIGKKATIYIKKGIAIVVQSRD